MPIHSATHKSLLLRLKSRGDDSAWAELVDRYDALLRGFARRRGASGADLDDIVQDVLLALTKAIESFQYDPDRGSFRGYLKTLASRAVMKRFSSERRRLEETNEVDDIASDPLIERDFEAEWRQYHLRRAMETARNEFNAYDLRAFELYAGGKKSAESVAVELGLTTEQVYQAKSRIMRRVRELIAAQSAEED